MGLVGVITRWSSKGFIEIFLNYSSLEYYLYILWHGSNHGHMMYLDSNSLTGEIKKLPAHLNRNGTGSESGEGTSNDKITSQVSTPVAVVQPEPSSPDLDDKTKKEFLGEINSKKLPNAKVDIVSNKDKETFPSTGPDGCLELKAELKRLAREPSNLTNDHIDDKFVKDYLKTEKYVLVDYNPKELLHLERVRDYFHALDNNIEPSKESKEAFKIRQKRYLDQASHKISWKGPPVDYNNPANVRLVAEEDLELSKVTADLSKHLVKAFEQAGYNPDMDKNPSVSEFLKLKDKIHAEHNKKYEEYYKKERIKDDEFYDTWSKEQLEFAVKGIKKAIEERPEALDNLRSVDEKK